MSFDSSNPHLLQDYSASANNNDVPALPYPQISARLSERSANGLRSFWTGKYPADLTMTSRRQLELTLKRAFDIVVSLLALAFLLPLLLMVTLAIRLSDPGPALFRQPRVGQGGRIFTIFKFRSMYMERCNTDGVDQTVAEDERIMPLGRFLRRTSIDELPQLLNVLRGDMSLVGPRPHVEGQLAAGLPYEHLVPYYSYRRHMRPGLTGWAQANGYRGPTSQSEQAIGRIDHDVAYIQNFSLLLDLRIILITMHREFLRGTGS
ncbi:sugar transferase [Devosia neptuniae]|jgi:lipopolysaccharide/colanic/teichoic acid biosynthesis glycosyltransferase|uniref:Sugar transferase n=1 Tax=Devosia neptuniae TaxID=191302 RepID=A0ABY6CCR3_9HYPH|nr:sugar transferase [Devosia neptuniae]UXN69021.1 sugar transferase [Devosia neptuniae]